MDPVNENDPSLDVATLANKMKLLNESIFSTTGAQDILLAGNRLGNERTQLLSQPMTTCVLNQNISTFNWWVLPTLTMVNCLVPWTTTGWQIPK